MSHKFARTAQLVYSLLVPITVLAFWAASDLVHQTKPWNVYLPNYQLAGLVLVGVGVFAQNVFREKP